MKKYRTFRNLLLLATLSSALSGCSSVEMSNSTASLNQYRWIMDGFSYPNYNARYPARLEFDEKQIAILPGCDRVVGNVQLKENTISFDKIKSTRLKCKLSALYWDKIITNEIQGAKILKIDSRQLILRGSNGYMMTFKSSPKMGTKGVQEHLWEISPKKVTCATDVTKKCLKIRTDERSDWRVLEEDITDFTFKEGIFYKILVLESANKYQPKYSLDAILSQNLVGTRQPYNNIKKP